MNIFVHVPRYTVVTEPSLSGSVSDSSHSFSLCGLPVITYLLSLLQGHYNSNGNIKNAVELLVFLLTDKLNFALPPAPVFKCVNCVINPIWLTVLYCAFFVLIYHLNQRSTTFSVKDQLVNILGFVGCMVFITATQLCSCRV